MASSHAGLRGETWKTLSFSELFFQCFCRGNLDIFFWNTRSFVYVVQVQSWYHGCCATCNMAGSDWRLRSFNWSNEGPLWVAFARKLLCRSKDVDINWLLGPIWLLYKMGMQTDLSPLAGGTCFKVIEHFVISRDSTTGKLDAPALLAWSKLCSIIFVELDVWTSYMSHSNAVLSFGT